MASNLNFPEDYVLSPGLYVRTPCYQHIRIVEMWRDLSLFFASKNFPSFLSHHCIHTQDYIGQVMQMFPPILHHYPCSCFPKHTINSLFLVISRKFFSNFCVRRRHLFPWCCKAHPSQAKCYKVYLSDSSITYFISIDIFWSSQALYRKKWLPEIYA